MVATDWTSHGAPADLVPAGYAISGLFDLTRLLDVSVNADLRLDAASAQAHSPLHWRLPSGATFDAVVGALESNELKRQSRTLAQAWSDRGVATRYEELPGNHFTVIAPLADPDSAMVRRLAALAELIRA
jgi:arylformamidase